MLSSYQHPTSFVHYQRLLDSFIEKLALDPSWVKNHPSYDELRTYGAIAA